jgi:hypothetical protein
MTKEWGCGWVTTEAFKGRGIKSLGGIYIIYLQLKIFPLVCRVSAGSNGLSAIPDSDLVRSPPCSNDVTLSVLILRRIRIIQLHSGHLYDTLQRELKNHEARFAVTVNHHFTQQLPPR